MTEVENKSHVSVILPTYNRAHLIGRSIQSILDQTYQDFEIIIVDDSSTDNTKEVVRSFNDAKIKYIRHQENRGGGAARNTGIEAAKSEYIAFQDSDDVWFPEKLEKQMEAFKKAPNDIGVVYTGFYRIENHVKTYIPSHKITKKNGNIHYELLKENFITTQAAVVKKECFEKAGMFDEQLPRLQDWELWIRISKYYTFKCIDEPLLTAYHQSDSITSNQNALTKAFKFILEKHVENSSANYEIMASSYFIMGKLLYFNGKQRGWQMYYRNAIKTNPLNIKLLVSIFISLFGPSVYNKVEYIYQKVNYTFRI